MALAAEHHVCVVGPMNTATLSPQYIFTALGKALHNHNCHGT
jgi:hypothetical protein